MVILNRDEAIGMCSRQGSLFLQKKIESPTTKFNQSKQRTSTLQRLSLKQVWPSEQVLGGHRHLAAGWGLKYVMWGSSFAHLHLCKLSTNKCKTSPVPTLYSCKCTGAASLWLRANMFNAMTTYHYFFLMQPTANPLQWVFKYLQWLFLSSRLGGGEELEGEILEAFNKNIHPIRTRET